MHLLEAVIVDVCIRMGEAHMCTSTCKGGWGDKHVSRCVGPVVCAVGCESRGLAGSLDPRCEPVVR